MSEREIRAALASVDDPEIHRPITDLGMVDGIHVGRRGRVTVRLLLTTSGCPLRERLRAEVEAAVRAVPGVRQVAVDFATMTARQRAELGERLRAGTRGVRDILGDRPAVYAVASGKGGVGKSTVTANLAVALAEAGKRVGVLDADVWGYSIPLLFGVDRAPITLGGAMLPVEAHGVRLMSTGLFVGDGGEPMVWRGPMLHKALQQFLDDVHWGELDVLLIDLPPGTGDITISLLDLVPYAQILVLTTPQPAARQVAQRAGRMAADLGVTIRGVVENMSRFACACGRHTPLFGTGGGAELADRLGVPLLGRVPLDLELRESGDIGVPVVVRHPNAASASALRDIAGSLREGRRSLVGAALPFSPA